VPTEPFLQTLDPNWAWAWAWSLERPGLSFGLRSGLDD